MILIHFISFWLCSIGFQDRKVDARDLRLKLQKKSQQQSGAASFSGVRDLREKLSGTMKPQAANNDPSKLKLEVTKTSRKRDTVETRRVATFGCNFMVLLVRVVFGTL